MRALVIGAAGQDGSYLSEQLKADGAEVFGLTREGLTGPTEIDCSPVTLTDRAAMRSLIEHGAFDQIYYLAAYHHSAEDRLDFEVDVVRRSFAVHVDGLLDVLDTVATTRSRAALFYAASSHVFGIVTEAPQTEFTPLAPICPYGISKTAGVQLCRLYRKMNTGYGRSTTVRPTARAPSWIGWPASARASRFCTARKNWASAPLTRRASDGRTSTAIPGW